MKVISAWMDTTGWASIKIYARVGIDKNLRPHMGVIKEHSGRLDMKIARGVHSIFDLKRTEVSIDTVSRKHFSKMETKTSAGEIKTDVRCTRTYSKRN